MKIFIKKLITQLYKIKFLKKCKIKSKCLVYKKSSFEGNNLVSSNCKFIASELGKYSYLSSNCSFYNTKIGRYCSIGENVQLVNAIHPLNYVSTHPLFHKSAFINKKTNCDNIFETSVYIENGYSLEIGNDVWIGNNVLIKGGIKIGDGSVIGMGSVVTHDVPAYSVVCGVPARVIKYRFNEKTICKLKEIKWWNHSEEWIKKNINNFNEVDTFIRGFDNENN